MLAIFRYASPHQLRLISPSGGRGPTMKLTATFRSVSIKLSRTLRFTKDLNWVKLNPMHPISFSIFFFPSMSWLQHHSCSLSQTLSSQEGRVIISIIRDITQLPTRTTTHERRLANGQWPRMTIGVDFYRATLWNDSHQHQYDIISPQLYYFLFMASIGPSISPLVRNMSSSLSLTFLASFGVLWFSCM